MVDPRRQVGGGGIETLADEIIARSADPRIRTVPGGPGPLPAAARALAWTRPLPRRP